MKKLIRKILNKAGYTLIKINDLPPDILTNLGKEFLELYNICKPFTMTSIESMYSLYYAIKYISKNNIPGDIVECGVWKGGSSMLAALTLLTCNDRQRNIYLYDTFKGMVKPSEEDVDYKSNPAIYTWNKMENNGYNKWCHSPLEETKINMYSTNYSRKKIYFIEGKVEDTIPNYTPKKISLLRLDTDWYESTYHELIHLFPKLSKHGVIIIDDYGHWKGSKKAVDKFFKETNRKIFLHRIDYSGRIGIKLD